MRYAIYFTPGRDDPLTRLASSWLGRDAYGREVAPPPAIGPLGAAEIAFHTAAARRYGFHATLKAPFHLAANVTESELVSALEDFCASRHPVVLPRVRLARLGGFFALVPDARSEALDRLAADVVTTFDRFRAPLSDADIARRNPDNLSPQHLKNLHRWGYPYVFEDFRFHMTLTGRVSGDESLRVERAIEEFFGPMLLEPFAVDSLALFVETEAGAPFTVSSFHEIGRMPARKTA
ncbi:MAG: DUF1045 domain-containing protein [Rhizobiaceae bacterium]|nr:DUF1045 domain-containing protein [Rhizobiaceae bacterium]